MQHAKSNFVKSRYRSPWRGMVLAREARKGRGDLLTVVILLDKNGMPMRRRRIAYLDEHWITEHSEIDLSRYNPDWFRLPKPVVFG